MLGNAASTASKREYILDDACGGESLPLSPRQPDLSVRNLALDRASPRGAIPESCREMLVGHFWDAVSGVRNFAYYSLVDGSDSTLPKFRQIAASPMVQCVDSDVSSNFASACVATMVGHTGLVLCLAFALDGTLCSGSKDHTIKVWHPELHKAWCLATLVAHTGSIMALAFSAAGLLCSGSDDRTVRVWDTDLLAARCLATLSHPSGCVSTLLFAPNGLLCSGVEDGTVKVWNVDQSRCAITLHGHTGLVSALAFAQDGTLCSGGDDRNIKCWDSSLTSCRCIATLRGHAGWVLSLLFARCGVLCSGSEDCTVRIWHSELRLAQCLAVLEGHNGWVSALALAADGSLCSGSADGTIKVWNQDLRAGRCASTLPGHSSWVSALAIAPHTGELCSASDDRTVRVWDPDHIVDAFWLRDKTVRTLARRSISLRQLLSFYERLELKRHASTREVVQEELLALTRSQRCSAAECFGPSGVAAELPQHYVVHAWDTPLQEVLGGLVYFATAQSTRELHIPTLEAKLREAGRSSACLDERYWFDAFCINLHLSHELVTPRLQFGDPRCEVDKYPEIMRVIHEVGGDVVVVFDQGFSLLRRAWCLNELHVAASCEARTIFSPPVGGALLESHFARGPDDISASCKIGQDIILKKMEVLQGGMEELLHQVEDFVLVGYQDALLGEQIMCMTL